MHDSKSHRGTGVDVVGTGFAVLDRIYADGRLADEALGGSCGNVLVSLAMLRRNVAPVLALGDDETGDMLIDEFDRAGAATQYIARRADLRSPVLAQELNTSLARHEFSFVCPDTSEDLPRFEPIGGREFAAAASVFSRCTVFYADRLSDSILQAMRTAHSAGATIFFEPSEIEDGGMFDEALRLVTVLKYSDDRIRDHLFDRSADCISIVTYGAAGLEVRGGGETIWCDAIKASVVLDTCGSGDMVSVGLIDWMLANRTSHGFRAAALIDGVVAGQRLAAENCAYPGARGVFKKRGAEYVRSLLSARSNES